VLERAADRTTAGVATGKGIGAEAKRGTPDIRQFGQAAREVLGDTVPDSGTAGRMLLPYLLSGGAAGANETFGGPGYLTALALAPLLYSRPVANYAVGNLIPGQAAAAAALRQGAPYASVLGMGISPQFGRQ
jgi:hypothetical protein